MYIVNIAIEATIVGIVLVLMWKYVKELLYGNELFKVFQIGLLTHILFEMLGANKWYCVRGAACSH